MSDVKKCAAMIWQGSSHYGCPNKGKIERGGKHYCGMHDPVAVREKYDAREAQRKAVRKVELAAQSASASASAEQVRKAACFDDLLAALQAIEHRAECNSFNMGEDITVFARAAIAKATTP